ncbi:primary cilium assembly protein FAM149B1 isoform X2 [Pseudophryne corroboree]|uniref:primary cilium assembly protein FAM149B1 isoform X2 n=1 Tax=Pseudophryne corroboree TaxID=495146 RepID=UPI0030813C8B
MISRYKRKPVSQTLQIAQTVTKAAENHLPDRLDTLSPTLHSDQYEEASDCESKSDVSGKSEFIKSDADVLSSEIQSCAGLSSDNSSIISWGFDEFDQAATRQVQKIFKQIDELLYEQKASTLVEGLKEECHEWTSSFPHLRLQGKQIVPPVDDGYRWYSSQASEAAASVPLNVTHVKDPSEMGIFGTRFPLSAASEASAAVSFSLYGDEDEVKDGVSVILSDGVMEEYLAFDSRDKDDEFFEWTRAMSLDSLKMGYPPISPQYCKKEAVVACVFDDVWREVVGCLEELICRHWEESITDDNRHDIAIKTTRLESLNPYAPLQRLPLGLPPVLHSKIPVLSPNLANRSQGGNIVTQRNLNDLMMIHGIPLQQRNLHLMEKVLDSGDKSPMRPTSALLSGKPWPGRSLEHSSSSLSHNVPSARRRNPPRTLHPINNNPSRSGTPKMEEVIRGTRLQTANDQLSCSPVPFNRNNLLPPIGTSDTEYHYLPGSQRQTPDNPLGRSFVISEQLRYRRGSEGIDSIIIGVTGIGLSIASSSASSVHLAHPLSERKEDREDQHSGILLHSTLKSHSRGGAFSRSRHVL